MPVRYRPGLIDTARVPSAANGAAEDEASEQAPIHIGRCGKRQRSVGTRPQLEGKRHGGIPAMQASVRLAFVARDSSDRRLMPLPNVLV
jgi:hypothetical protein